MANFQEVLAEMTEAEREEFLAGLAAQEWQREADAYHWETEAKGETK